MAQTEVQSYNVIQKISDAEIRFYPPVMMAKHTSKTQGSGFGKLFGYISGNNTNKTKQIFNNKHHSPVLANSPSIFSKIIAH